MGLLVRTEAEGKAEEAIIEDLEALQKQWELIQQEANSTRPPALLNRDDDFIQRVLRDMYTSDVNRIVVDSHTGVKRVKQHLLNWSGGRMPDGVLIDHHRDRIPILDYFRVNAAIREALKPRVDLPSGGYVIIEPTEALTVIDVNSGSFTRSATARETVLWTNCEAATEIARQLRLRNIAGVIIVDFIDMDSRRDQLQVLEHFNKALKGDKARPQIAQLSELGLVELTRKRQGQNIYELFGGNCPTCGGLGHLVHLPGESDRTTREATEPAASSTLFREARMPDLAEPPDIDTLNDTEELDVFQHPSYLDRAGANNNRRRRRRRDELPVKEEVPVTRVSNRSIAVPQLRTEPVLEADSVSEVTREVGRDNSIAGLLTKRGASIPEELGVAARTSVPEPVERVAKPQLGRPSKEVEPPEVVSIEMTPEEQDVYAFMGISPLVRLDRDVKNPKSVILSVVLPGEAAQTQTSDETPLEASVESSTEALDSSVTSHEAEKSELMAVTVPDETPVPELSTDFAATSESDSSSTIVRRRRRRSSALESEDATSEGEG
jgi:ribonuclease E